MYTAHGSHFRIADYKIEGDFYRITWLGGASTRERKAEILRFEPIASYVPFAVAPAPSTGVDPGPGFPIEATVARIVDGDTIEIDSGDKVRLIAVDTSETADFGSKVQPFSKQATLFTRSALEGEKVRLVYDKANIATGHRGGSGRLLAYVVRVRDGLDFNAELVREGYAHANLKYPSARGEEFLAYEREARENQRGLWNRSKPTSDGQPADDAPIPR
jgi:micrococcal nuclease